MEIRELVAKNLTRIMHQRAQSFKDFAASLNIARSSLQCYMKGATNLRSDTIEMLAERLGISPVELISEDCVPQERGASLRAERLLAAAHELSGLEPKRREKAERLLLELVEVLADGGDD